MRLFSKLKSDSIRSRVLDHIEPLIKQGEDEHEKNVQKAHEQYHETVEVALEHRENQKELSASTIVSKIVK